MGVAQVMGRKPILTSGFSSGALSWVMAVSVPSGSTLAMAAMAVLRPTARRNARRRAASGKRARSAADSSALALRFSSLGVPRVNSASCSPALWLPPQGQRNRRGRSESCDGFVMVHSRVVDGCAATCKPQATSGA